MNIFGGAIVCGKFTPLRALLPTLSGDDARVIASELDNKWMAADGSSATVWSDFHSPPAFWGFHHDTPAQLRIFKYLSPPSGMETYGPFNFIVQGSNDGTTWIDIHSVTGLSNGLPPLQWQSFDVPSADFYNYHRVYFGDHYGLYMPGFEFWGY